MFCAHLECEEQLKTKKRNVFIVILILPKIFKFFLIMFFFFPALVGSLAIGSTFFFSPLAGIITDRIGIRWTTFVGGAMASGGMLLSSFSNSVGIYIRSVHHTNV